MADEAQIWILRLVLESQTRNTTTYATSSVLFVFQETPYSPTEIP